jgi:branched-chain amino acid transport system permease protein
MEFWIIQTFNGFSYAALLFLLAGGFSLIFGVMNIVNITHGSFYLVSGYVGFRLINLTGNYFVGIILAGLCGACLGMIIEPVFLRRFEGNAPENELNQMLVTMGLAFIIQDVCLMIWGGDPFKIPLPSYLNGYFKVGTLALPKIRFFIIASAFVIYFVMWWFQEKTNVGAKTRACVDNEEMAGGIGISVALIRIGVFTLGALLCGFAGVIGASFLGAYPGMEFEILTLAFVIVIVGGLGNLTGALLGSIIVGLLDNFGKTFVPELAYFTLFAPLAVILAFRPTGILGRSSS